jgi:hypothetical protein
MTLPPLTIQSINKAILIIASIFIIEFSIILSGFWMLGDFNKIRFGVWPMSEWLINYQGGFVRRGIFGEILFQMNIGKPLIPILNQLTYYFFVMYCAIFLLIYWLAKIKNLRILIVALLIPGGIFQMSISASFFTRKEILFLILFGLLCLIYLRIKNLSREKRQAWIIIFSILASVGGIALTLTHEAFLMMSFPYCLGLFYILKRENKDVSIAKFGFNFFLISIPLIFIICVTEHGDISIAENIWNSLTLADRLNISPNAPFTLYGAIGGIGWSKLQNLSTLYGVIVTGGWIYWIFFGCGNLLVIKYMMTQSIPQKRTSNDERYLRITKVIFLSTLLMFMIGSDWGRWIASTGNHLILLSFTLIGSMNASQIKNLNIITTSKNSSWFFPVILMYELIFKMPECCVEYPYLFIEYKNIFEAFTH